MSTRIGRTKIPLLKIINSPSLCQVSLATSPTSSLTIDRNDWVEEVEFSLRIILPLQRQQPLKPRIFIAVYLFDRLIAVGIIDVRIQSSTGSVSRNDNGAETSAILGPDGVVRGRRCVLGQKRAVRSELSSVRVSGCGEGNFGWIERRTYNRILSPRCAYAVSSSPSFLT